MIGKDDTTRLAASATTSATSTTRPYRHLQAALVGLSRGLFDLESESAWPLHEPRSDSPWHVFGFIDAYSTSGQDIPKVAKLNKWVLDPEPVLVKAGEDKVVRMNNDTFYQSALVVEEQGAPVIEARETLDLVLQLAERLDKAYEQSSNGAREQLNETVFQRIIVENKHLSDYELAEPFRSLLEDRVFQNRNSGGAEGI